MQNHNLYFIKRIVSFFLAILFFIISHTISVFGQNLTTKTKDSTSNYGSYDSFFKRNSFKKLYLVFAGPYPASPTSSFGHIFLLAEPKLNKPFLLWDAIDFSADITNVGSIEFFLKGTFGGLIGQYKILPFYEKLREYTFIESRSLWLFPLDLNNTESNIFLKNLFSNLDKTLPYNFANKNCASEDYKLLSSSITKYDELNNILILPSDIISITKNDSIIFLESENSALSRLNNHDELDIKRKLNYLEWKSFRDGYIDDTTMSNIKNLRKEIVSSNNNSDKNYNSLSKISKNFSIHPTMLTNLSYQYDEKLFSKYLLKYRFGLHDFFDRNVVYPKHDYLNLLSIEIGINKNLLYLKELLLFEQFSLQPISNFSNYPSWKIGVGYKQDKGLGLRQQVSGLFFAYGYTFPIFNEDLALSFLLNAEPLILNKDDYSLFIGSETILRWHISDNLKFYSSFRGIAKDISYFKYFFEFQSKMGYNISNSVAISINFSLSKYIKDYTFEFKYYLE